MNTYLLQLLIVTAFVLLVVWLVGKQTEKPGQDEDGFSPTGSEKKSFKVIDEFTKEEADSMAICSIAAARGLMVNDIEGFAVTQDGHLILLDECGKYTFVDMSRFVIKYED